MHPGHLLRRRTFLITTAKRRLPQGTQRTGCPLRSRQADDSPAIFLPWLPHNSQKRLCTPATRFPKLRRRPARQPGTRPPQTRSRHTPQSHLPSGPGPKQPHLRNMVVVCRRTTRKNVTTRLELGGFLWNTIAPGSPRPHAPPPRGPAAACQILHHPRRTLHPATKRRPRLYQHRHHGHICHTLRRRTLRCPRTRRLRKKTPQNILRIHIQAGLIPRVQQPHLYGRGNKRTLPHAPPHQRPRLAKTPARAEPFRLVPPRPPLPPPDPPVVRPA